MPVLRPQRSSSDPGISEIMAGSAYFRPVPDAGHSSGSDLGIGAVIFSYTDFRNFENAPGVFVTEGRWWGPWRWWLRRAKLEPSREVIEFRLSCLICNDPESRRDFPRGGSNV